MRMPNMKSASKNMASMSHCCGFVQPLQHRFVEVALLDNPLRLGVPLPDIRLLTAHPPAKGGPSSDPK